MPLSLAANVCGALAARTNAAVLHADATDALDRWIAPAALDAIYVNHPEPPQQVASSGDAGGPEASHMLSDRLLSKAAAAVEELKIKIGTETSVEVMLLDVSSLASVNAFAASWGARALHVLVCNAGIMMGPQRQSVDGFDLQLATNYLGHFHLVNLLRDRLIASAPARVLIESRHPAPFFRFRDRGVPTARS